MGLSGRWRKSATSLTKSQRWRLWTKLTERGFLEQADGARARCVTLKIVLRFELEHLARRSVCLVGLLPGLRSWSNIFGTRLGRSSFPRLCRQQCVRPRLLRLM